MITLNAPIAGGERHLDECHEVARSADSYLQGIAADLQGMKTEEYHLVRVSVIKRMLEDEGGLTQENIPDRVAEKGGVTKKGLYKNRQALDRCPEPYYSLGMLMYYAYRVLGTSPLTTLSYSKIAKIVGRKDHTTIMDACTVIGRAAREYHSYVKKAFEVDTARLIAHAPVRTDPEGLTLVGAIARAEVASMRRNFSFGNALDLLAEETGVPADIIAGRGKQGYIVQARNAAYYLLREKLRLSFPMIAACTKREDHTTVLKGYRKFSDLKRGTQLEDAVRAYLAQRE